MRALALTLTAVALTAVIQATQNQAWGYGPVRSLGAVRAEDPLALALLRTPLSLFVPALDLPVWARWPRSRWCSAWRRCALGRWRTLAVAYGATLAGTLYARVGVALGPGTFPGLPASDAQVVDTGPSAAVVGLAVYVCHQRRAWFTGALVVLAMVVEVLVKDNLAGREHLAAIAAVLVVCGVREWLGGGAAPGIPARLSGLAGRRKWDPVRGAADEVLNFRRGPAQRTSWW